MRINTLPMLLKREFKNRYERYVGRPIESRRENWWKSQLGRREYVETKIKDDVKMRLYFDCQLSKQIYYKKFERNELHFLTNFIKPGDIFIDVGANIGLYTLIAARKVGENGHVHSFEPCQKTYQRLIDNVKLNDLANVSCCRSALSSECGRRGLTVSLDGYDAWNSFGRPFAGESFTKEMVDCVTLDSYAQKEGLIGRITMIKIDAEGWEGRIIKGSSQVLGRNDAPILQVEFTDRTLGPAGSSRVELYRMLEELGYHLYSYDLRTKKLIPAAGSEDYSSLNLIGAKRTDVVLSRLAR